MSWEVSRCVKVVVGWIVYRRVDLFLWISYRIDFHHLAAPNLANSAVLKMLEEEERQRGGKGESMLHIICFGSSSAFS